MGRQKEELLEREEQARRQAPKCEICGEPLLSSKERTTKACSSCAKAMAAD